MCWRVRGGVCVCVCVYRGVSGRITDKKNVWMWKYIIAFVYLSLSKIMWVWSAHTQACSVRNRMHVRSADWGLERLPERLAKCGWNWHKVMLWRCMLRKEQENTLQEPQHTLRKKEGVAECGSEKHTKDAFTQSGFYFAAVATGIHLDNLCAEEYSVNTPYITFYLHKWEPLVSFYFEKKKIL